ncbi:MAG: thiamine-phosphate kinase [Bacteroidetes bacterium]|nr:thiamine-phosphate kinase [Bacteroidota bacterium]
MYKKKDKKPDDAGSRLTSLAELGEFGLIDRLTKNVSHFHPETLKGIGDDAAVIDAGEKVILLSTDLLVEGIHFDLTYMPFRHLGYKAAVVNISDIAAMNGIPTQMTVSLAVSSKFSAEALDELYAGILMACNQYKVDLVGGDTSSNVKGLMISVSIIGVANKEDVVYRNGARSGDLLCVTGDLGSAYVGLLILEREKSVFQVDPNMQPELSGFDYQIGRQLRPEARTDIRNLLLGTGIRPTSMIDISDGLASEILHICKQSGVGCKLFEAKIPIDEHTRELAKEYKIIPSVAALSGGEDYELLFTVKQDDYEKIKDVAGITIIGHMTAPSEGKYMITPDGKSIPITAQGWDGMRGK